MDFADAPAEAEFREPAPRRGSTTNNPGPAGVVHRRRRTGGARPRGTGRSTTPGSSGSRGRRRSAATGCRPTYDAIVDDELAAAGAPPRPGLGYLVQGILEHGNDDIRPRFLPGIVNGRDRWCQGFSEPDAGSDLASLRTRAERDGDTYVVTGHKVWTSYSDDADWCLLLARTDHDVAKHKGISAFAVPMDQPGIERRPLRMINGITKEFGEVRFDGARVPAANMIGAPGEGWRLAMTVVSHEREPGELGYVARYRKIVNELVAEVRRRPGELRRRAAARRSAGRSSRPRCCASTCAAGCRTASTASRTDPTARSTSCS